MRPKGLWVIGNDYARWPGERWLDIRQIDLLAPIVRARLDHCAAEGFDGIEPDNVDGYANDTGFPLTYQDQLGYNIWLAGEAHARRLSIGLKNDEEQVTLGHFTNQVCPQAEAMSLNVILKHRDLDAWRQSCAATVHLPLVLDGSPQPMPLSDVDNGSFVRSSAKLRLLAPTKVPSRSEQSS